LTELPAGTVTFLFTDLEASTRLWEEYPEAMGDALTRHDEILRSVIDAQGGHVVKTTGDGVHAAFAASTSAVLAARDAQLGLAGEAWGQTGPLRVRMGIHTCQAEVRDGDYYGSAVNRAARLMSVANGAQVVLSLATEELAREGLPSDVSLLDLGEHRLRDLSHTERVFQLCAPGLPSEFPPLQSLDAFPGNLPRQLSSFVGRDDEVAAVAKALTRSPLVTLTGVGGVGKTRLALQVGADIAPEYTDGVWLSELAGVNDDQGVVQLVAATLGVQPRANASLEECVIEFLRGRTALLIFDNCEHLLDAAARLAGSLLQRCPHVRVIATSREGLALEGEQVWPLRSLPVPARDGLLDETAANAAVRLFVDRAAMARPGFALDAANVASVSEICRRLDGLPLAIELAAARVSSMRPADIAARLGERFRLLTGGRRTAVERHQTLRATVDWSYSLLEENERRAFDRLGVFAGEFDAEAAEVIAGGDGLEPWDVVDAIAGLVDKSMLDDEESAGGTTRYRMLETLRQYALERLADHADIDAWRRRHADHYARSAETIGIHLVGPDEVGWRHMMRLELDNFRSAVTWALDREDAEDVELAVRIVAALASESYANPSVSVGSWAEQAAGHLDATTPGRRATVLGAAATSAMVRGDFALARVWAEAAMSEGTPSDWRLVSFPFVALAYSQLVSGQHDDAVATATEGERMVRAVGTDPWDLVHMLNTVSSFGAMNQNDERALPAAEEAVRIGRELDNQFVLIGALHGLSRALARTDVERAKAAAEESLELSHASTNSTHGSVAAFAAYLRARTGDQVGAAEALRDAFLHFAEVGDRPQFLGAVTHAIRILGRSGEYEVATTLLGVAVDGPLAALNNFPDLRLEDSDPLIDKIHRELGNTHFAACRARGAAMKYEEAVDYAIVELDRIAVTLADA